MQLHFNLRSYFVSTAINISIEKEGCQIQKCYYLSPREGAKHANISDSYLNISLEFPKLAQEDKNDQISYI